MKAYTIILFLFALPFGMMAGSQDSLVIKDTACNKKEIFLLVEQMPDYTGGLVNLAKQLNNTVLSKDTFNGPVLLYLNINCKGRIFGIEVKKSVGDIFDHRITEGLLKYQDWMPGKQNGHPIDCRIPLRLTIVKGLIKME